jgi:TonB family protein
VWLEVPVTFVSPNAPSDTVKPERPRAAQADTVEEAPELFNRNDVVRTIGREYPRDMRDAGVHGSVTVRFRISAMGIPDAPRVDRASRPEFVEPAIRVVHRMRFHPARVNGKPVAVWVTLPISFMLQAPPLPGEPGAPAQPSSRPPGAGGGAALMSAISAGSATRGRRHHVGGPVRVPGP